MRRMAKLDPIISEFATSEDEEAYDKWFRAEVEAGLAETGPGIPHEQVMAEAQAIIDKHLNALPESVA
jgi:predicted transcriptional regulator